MEDSRRHQGDNLNTIRVAFYQGRGKKIEVV
jgi:hypothetical protein